MLDGERMDSGGHCGGQAVIFLGTFCAPLSLPLAPKRVY